MPSTSVIFPYYFDPRWEDLVANAFMHQLMACTECGYRLLAYSDGPPSPRFEALCQSRKVDLHVFEEHRGLTRSWNKGAEDSFWSNGDDVCILSNFDAWPSTDLDLSKLSEAALSMDWAFAIGPITNEPGHCQAQMQRASAVSKPVAWINGFTWAVNREHYAEATKKRGYFLRDSLEERFVLIEHGGGIVSTKSAPCHPSQTLAMVGQEDELFYWAARNLNTPCAVADIFWIHDKLQSFRKMEEGKP